MGYTMTRSMSFHMGRTRRRRYGLIPALLILPLHSDHDGPCINLSNSPAEMSLISRIPIVIFVLVVAVADSFGHGQIKGLLYFPCS